MLGGIPLLVGLFHPNANPRLITVGTNGFLVGFVIGVIAESFFGFNAEFRMDGIRVKAISATRFFKCGHEVNIVYQVMDSKYGRLDFSWQDDTTTVFFIVDETFAKVQKYLALNFPMATTSSKIGQRFGNGDKS